MANMSYCRFRNTLEDLRDCADAFDDRSELSEAEAAAADQLLLLCDQIASDWETDIEEIWARKKAKREESLRGEAA